MKEISTINNNLWLYYLQTTPLNISANTFFSITPQDNYSLLQPIIFSGSTIKTTQNYILIEVPNITGLTTDYIYNLNTYQTTGNTLTITGLTSINKELVKAI